MIQTIKERAFEYIRRFPGKSAYEVAVAIGSKWGTVSSYFYRAVQAGTMRREGGLGPKGGFGYFLTGGEE